jgi:hypothetical protein
MYKMFRARFIGMTLIYMLKYVQQDSLAVYC